MSVSSGYFDNQAETYDQRAGLSKAVCRAIVQAVLGLAEPEPGDLLAEMGAGTGMIGRGFAQSGLCYVGIDWSRGMLTRFRRRLVPNRPAWLVLADGNCPWPLADGSTRAIFSSRALHWLASEHVVDETLRVAHPDHAILLTGRVQRDRDSPPAQMQREMQRQLRQHGLQPRQGARYERQLIDAYRHRGATAIEPVTVAQWSVPRAPRLSIASWRSKPGLGGLDLPGSVKTEILNHLCQWAEKALGGLDTDVACDESYVIQGVRLR
jgi:ubiquinone/menaquinone biosynthesis C-methylase UbiE